MYKRAKPTESTSSVGRHDTAASAESLEALTREVSALGRLRGQDNIVQLLGVAWESISKVAVQPVLVLEYVDLGTLQSLVFSQSGTDLSFQQKRDFCEDIAAGMATVHAHQLIWGDLKPENILIFSDDHRIGGLKAKISDFGLCESNVTSEATFRGISRPWTAPEADPGRDVPTPAKGFDALVRAEVYAFGMLVFAIAMDGHHGRREHWEPVVAGPALPHRPPMAPDEIEHLKCDAITHVRFIQGVLASVKSHLQEGPGGMPIASPSDVAMFTKLLKQCLVYDPRKRSGSMSEIVRLINNRVYISAPSESTMSRFRGSFDHEFLMSSYGSHTKLSPLLLPSTQSYRSTSAKSNRVLHTFRAACVL